MIWIIALSVLLVVIVTIILITVYRAKKSETVDNGKSRQNYEYYHQEEEPNCCKNCDYSNEESDNRIWCTERNIYVFPDTVCPYYRGLIREMAKQIVKDNNL